MIIQYGSLQEIEEHILNIEDKTGVFLIEPKGKGTLLVSSFATGKSEELRADLLESYFKETKSKCEYRLAPLDSKLYAIKTIEEEVVPQPPKGFNIYGDPV